MLWVLLKFLHWKYLKYKLLFLIFFEFETSLLLLKTRSDYSVKKIENQLKTEIKTNKSKNFFWNHLAVYFKSFSKTSWIAYTYNNCFYSAMNTVRCNKLPHFTSHQKSQRKVKLDFFKVKSRFHRRVLIRWLKIINIFI